MTTPVALSLTPLPLEADSRTLRVAASLARLGFQSRVIEGQESHDDPTRGLPIELLARQQGAPPRTAAHPTSSARPGLLSSAISTVRQGHFGVIGNWALYAAYRSHFARRFKAHSMVGDEGLVYLHSYEYYEGMADRARRAGVPIVYDAHDYYQGITPVSERAEFDRKFLLPFLRQREEACVNGSAAVVTVSEGTADLIEKEYGRRPLVLRNGHDPRLDIQPELDLRTKLGLTSAEILVVVVGNYKAGMAIESVIQALASLPAGVHVAFVGRGYPASLVPAECIGRMHVGIAMPPRQIVPFITTADIGLVAYKPISDNYKHALPNGFFQVVAAGLPLLYPALPEIEATIGGLDVGWRMADVTGSAIVEGIARIRSGAASCRQNVRLLAARISWENDEKSLARLVESLLPHTTRRAS